LLKDLSKKFAVDIDGVEARDPNGEIDVNAAQSTVIQYRKDFTAGWQLEHDAEDGRYVSRTLKTHYEEFDNNSSTTWTG
jgi:hypothetical protein